MFKTMSLEESSSVVSAGAQPLFSKFKSRTKEAESPKSVISDPRIVSPSSSASASLERRLTDLKKVPRHDRVHSISDADEENALPGVNLSAVLLSRQLSAKASNCHLLLEPVSEVHSSSAVHPRMGQISGPCSETSSPRVKMSRNAGKNGAKGFARGSDNEFANRRMSYPGAETTTSSVFAPLPHPTDLEGVYTESFTCSTSKCSTHDESDRTWRNAAGFRDPRPIPLQTLAREHVQGTRLAREDSFQAVNLQLEGKTAAIGPVYNVMNGFNGSTLEERVSGRGTSRPDEPILGENSTVENDTELPYEDQIELNKFVVSRGSGGEEIRTGHKIALSPGHRNSFSGDGRSSVSGYRQSKTTKKIFSPSDSPGHTNGFHESPRSTLIELSSDFVMKTTAQGLKDSPEMQTVQKESRTYTLKSTSHSDYCDKSSSARLLDGWKKSADNQIESGAHTNTLGSDGTPSLHALPSLHSQTGMAGAGVLDGHYPERSFQYGLKVPGGDTGRASLMPQQRFPPGQFLKSNPLKPRPPPAKWDDAEKWLVNPASVKSNSHSSYGNGTLSGSSTPQHCTQFHATASVRLHNLPSSNQSSRMFGASGESLPNNADSYGARSLPENGDVSPSAYPPTNVVHVHRSYDSSTTTYRPEESLQVDMKVSELSNRDETGTRSEDKFADSITIQSTSPGTGRLIIVMKDAATEITPSTSQRDISTQVTPAPSFHAAVTPPRIHNGGPARLNTTPVHSERRPASVGVDVTELKNCHQAKLELDRAATLDTNWTTREEEVEESSRSLRLSVSRSVDFKEVKRNVLEARAVAWEEAEQSKYMARYHREEAKILAWEANEKAKAEADMRKVEVKLERMRSHANELLQNKLASVHLKAENMRAAAATKCGEQAAKTNHRAQEIRYHGRSPSPSRLCCFPRFKSTYTK